MKEICVLYWKSVDSIGNFVSSTWQPWAVVTILGNDLMNGEIGFIPGSQQATVDEDGAATGKNIRYVG